MLLGSLPEILIIANTIFISVVGLSCAGALGVAAYDRYISKNPVKHAYPLLNRFIKPMDRIGRILRNHVISQDRQDMPFNREQMDGIRRYIVYRSNITPFGSTVNTHLTGNVSFIPGTFPSLQPASTSPLVIGPYCKKPYTAKSIFNISAMSYGAISDPVTRAFSIASKLTGCWANTGEGALAEAHLHGGGDVVFQMGTAKYGVGHPDHTLDEGRLREVVAHPEIVFIEIKMAQAAKPGEGGILLGAKVTKQIAELRGIPEGVTSHSPSRHVEASNHREMLDLINRVRNIAGIPVGVKIVIADRESADAWCLAIKDYIADHGVESAPDFFTLDGAGGGTGAAPTVLMDNMGVPLRECLPILSQSLIEHGLKQRIRIIASGKLVTADRVAWAIAAGADFANSARAPMVGAGCEQFKQCHANTCPKGITTNDPELLKGMDPAQIGRETANLIIGIREDVERIAHSCGLADVRDLRPHHVNIVQADGRNKKMSEIFPGLKF